MGFGSFLEKFGKKKRQEKTRIRDNGLPQQSPNPVFESRRRSIPVTSPPKRSPPPVPTSSCARTDKGKGIMAESSRRRQSSPPHDTRKGVVIKDAKEQYSSDSDSDLHSDISEPSPQHNPQPSNYPPSGYGYSNSNYNLQQGYGHLMPSYPYPSVYSHWNYHPEKAEIPENEKWMFNAVDSIFKWP
ncbi:hypothetical protein ACOSQ3_019898 [Xanthoceras sorbifolium]